MRLLSDYNKDVRTKKKDPGAYEWWYFDGVDSEGIYSFVIIFYEGNPFSTRYMKRQRKMNRGSNGVATEYPAVSISIYQNQQPIYYSFTEFRREDCTFDDTKPFLSVGDHTMEGSIESGTMNYRLNLKESLPSGDRLVGHLSFRASEPDGPLFSTAPRLVEEGHVWNLVQPRAEVEGKLKIFARVEPDREIGFDGTGYHDHNMGKEPMRNEFKDWYWGRFHFELGTLVYYIMDRRDSHARQQQGWLVSPENGEVLQQFPNIELQDLGWTKFGMKSARKILMGNDQAHVVVQQARILDDGPFYQRFSSDSYINIAGQDIMEVAEGISEYIRPDRIHWRIFWPILNMRIRYLNGKTHWVQRSKMLYRLTW
ncbi:MAG: hypothetical protein R3224_09845 [Balneolaceae bacterium]|nr:hypothetical protein [Balneolaceae bacterium]